MTERLTTLAAVKEWLGVENDSSDSLLIRTIESASQAALRYMNRSGFARQNHVENFKGNGKDRVLLRNWPVLSVASVGTRGTSITPSVLGTAGLPGSGYTVSDDRQSPQSIELYGYGFFYRMPCQVIYDSGYEASQTFLIVEGTDSSDTLPLVPTEGGQWIGDLGVTIDSVDAVKVSLAPATGEYSVDEWGTYLFAVADIGKTAVIRYSYCPISVSFGVTEMVGEWFKRRDRIGVSAKSLSGGVGENMTFSNSAMTDSVLSYLQPYQNVVPL